jgi:hypothetical protein
VAAVAELLVVVQAVFVARRMQLVVAVLWNLFYQSLQV